MVDINSTLELKKKVENLYNYIKYTTKNNKFNDEVEPIRTVEKDNKKITKL